MKLHPIIKAQLPGVESLCKQLQIKELYFFGSSINGKFIPGKSDLDVLVDTGRGGMKSVVRLQLGLRELYACNVDIFHMERSLDAELLEYLKENKLRVYRENNL